MKIKAVLIKPGERAEVVEIENELEALREAVGGHIKLCPLNGYPEKGIIAYCNEDGKFLGLPPNRAIYQNGKVVDIIAGNIIVLGISRDNEYGEIEECSLTDEQIDFVMKIYGAEEYFYFNQKGKLTKIKRRCY